MDTDRPFEGEQDDAASEPGVNEKYLQAKQDSVDRARRKGQTGEHPREAQRLPPGQRLVTGFPVLDLGIQPAFDPATWTFNIDGEVENPVRWSWEDWKALPRVEAVADFHCVTHWSKYDVEWAGVAWSTVLEIVKPKDTAKFVLMACGDRYTTNVPFAETLEGDVLLADTLYGEPLPLEHGGPVRMIIPGLYAWKSAKFLQAIRFSESDAPGFWEVRGYHNHGDPWREQRYSDY